MASHLFNQATPQVTNLPPTLSVVLAHPISVRNCGLARRLCCHCAYGLDVS